MEKGKELQSGSGFISPGGRIFFFCLALIPGTLMMLGALLTEAPDFLNALGIGLIVFLPSMFFLLVLGRSVEHVRDTKWHRSPDRLSNAPWKVQLGVYAFIAISTVPTVLDLLANKMSWPLVWVYAIWNVLVMWVLAHVFAVKIIRGFERFLKRGKQGL